MSRGKRKECPWNEPDCFNCPFPECYATIKDINRQNAYQEKKAQESEIQDKDLQYSHN